MASEETLDEFLVRMRVAQTTFDELAAWYYELKAENARLREIEARSVALVDEATRRVPPCSSAILQAIAAAARLGLDRSVAQRAREALDELMKLASSYPAARAKAEADAERDTNQRLTDERGRLAREVEEARGLLHQLADTVEGIAGDEVDEMLANASEFLARTAPSTTATKGNDDE